LAMGGRTIGEAVAKECVEVFLSTKFDGGRHQKRVDKLGSC
jgi:ribose 5-phosphate isomerase B